MSRKLLVGTLLAAAGILALVFGLDRPTAIYSVGVSELAARKLWDRPVRVHGVLVHGTLCRVDAECGYRFRLANRPRFSENDAGPSHSGEQLSVSYDGCVVPDNLRDVPGIDLEVTAEGERCRNCHDFKATQIIVWSSEKYQFGKRDRAQDFPAQPTPRCPPLSSM
jgi:cytochrome c-type biogenesis protein CcmE